MYSNEVRSIHFKKYIYSNRGAKREFLSNQVDYLSVFNQVVQFIVSMFGKKWNYAHLFPFEMCLPADGTYQSYPNLPYNDVGLPPFIVM